jgi:hypothetical protein
MGLIRTDPESGNFFIGHKAWAEDERLSWETRGLLAYLFSKPDDWEVRMGDLVASGPCEKHKLRSMMGELVEYGYATRDKTRADDGTFEWETTIHERPPPTQSGMDSIHDGSSPGYSKKHNSTKNNGEGGSGSAGAAARDDAPTMPDDLLPLYDTYEDTVNDLLADLSPQDVDALVMTLWNQAGVGSVTLRLHDEYEWPYFVSGVVITANEANNPNPRYLDTLLTALTDLDEHTGENPTEDEQQSNLERLWNAARTA